MAGPTVESVTTATSSGAETWDITGVVVPSGLTDGLLVVGNSFEYGNSGNPSEVTGVVIDPGGANEAAFTRVNTANVYGSYGNESSLWYLADADIPPAGTYTVRVTTDLPSSYAYTVYAASGCYVLSGAAQSGIPDAQNTQTATTSTGVTTSLTTSAADTLVLGSYSQGDNNAPTANSGQTVRWDLESGTSRGTSSSKALSSAGTESLGYTHDSSNRVAHAIAAFAAAAGATTRTVTASLDSAVKKQDVVLNAQVDAALKKVVQLQAQADAVVQAVDLALVASLDAALRKNGLTLQSSLDSILMKVGSVGSQVDALVQALGVTKQSSLDAALRRLGVSVGASLDSALQKQGLAVSSALDAVLAESGGGTTVTVGTLLDALLQRKGVVVSAQADAALKKVGIVLAGAVDAALQKRGLSLAVVGDAVLRKIGVVKEANVDSALRKAGLVVRADLDAMIEKVGIVLEVGLDAYLILRKFLGVEVDAYLGKLGIVVGVGLDAFLRIPTGQWNEEAAGVAGNWTADGGVAGNWTEDSGVGNSWK